MEDVGHLVNLTAVWYTIEYFKIFYGHLVHFFLFWYVAPREIWQPWAEGDLFFFRKQNFPFLKIWRNENLGKLSKRKFSVQFVLYFT
jgi:hypothetical protein